MERHTPSPPSLITPVALWRVEDGSEPSEYAGPDICHAAVIEAQEREVLWYTQHFIGKEHSNWVGVDDTHGPYAFSFVREETKTRCILWLPSGAQNATLHIPMSEPLTAIDAMKKSGWNMTKKKLKEMKRGEMLFSSGLESSVSSLASSSSTISQAEKDRGNASTVFSKWEVELMKMENKMASRFQNYKFGILYVKAGQKTEEEMFSNRVSSSAFRDFCKIIGDKVELKDWPFFSGGLDTKSDRTGRHSLYTQHCGYEIMFHVSTMLPWNDSDQQQIDRKRHIGNDVVIIAFIDEDAKDLWCPTIVSSRFPHLYAVVKPVSGGPNGANGYMFNLAVKDTVSQFGPPLPQPPIFYEPAAFRLFLLSKLINGEREAIRTVNDFHQNSAYLSDLQDLYEKVSRASSSSSSSASSATPEKLSGKEALFKDSIDFAHSTSAVPHLGSLSSLGSSSPNLFHHALHNSASISRDPKEGREAMLSGLGGSFQIPSSSSSRDLLKGQLLGGSGSVTGSGKVLTGSSSNSPSLPHSSSRMSLVITPQLSSSPSGEDGLLKKSLQSAPLALYAATEQMQAFQNKPALLNFPAEITCAETWEGRLMIVGSVDGLFVVDLNQQSTSKSAAITEVNCLVHKGQPYRHNCYQQLAIIEELNILLAIVAKVGVLMYDLTSLLSVAGPSELVLRKTKGATTFSLGAFQNILQLAVSTPRGIVIHRWTNDIFTLSQIIQLPPPIVMEFDSKGFIVAASPGEYYFVKPDPDSPTMNSLYTWSEKERSLEPITVLLFEDTGEYLLCFDLVGFFVNSVGHKTRNYEFRWLATPTSIVSVHPYLLIFTQQHLEVRYVSNGALVQLIELDTRHEGAMKFMTTGTGICFASISINRDTTPSPSGSGASAYKEGKDLTSSSSSSTTTNPSTSPQAPNTSQPPLSAPSVAFNATRSTIHILRLNSIQTCLVTNPATIPSQAFLIHGLIHSVGSSSTPSSAAIPIPHGISHRKLNLGRKVVPGVSSSVGSGGGASTPGQGDISAGSSPHSPGGVLQYMINEGTASFDDSDEVFRMAAEDGGSVYYRRKSPGRDQRSSMTIGSLGSNGSASTNTSTPSNQGGTTTTMLAPGQLASMLRFQSADAFVSVPGSSGTGSGSANGSPSKASFRNYGDDAVPPGRMSTSAKIARRKSLALETEQSIVRRKQQTQQQQQSHTALSSHSRHSTDFNDDFDFEFEPPGGREGATSHTPGGNGGVDMTHSGRRSGSGGATVPGPSGGNSSSRKDFSESSESPRKQSSSTIGSSPIATPIGKKKRGASDKLSGSSERSPRSSPTIASPDTLKEFAERRSSKKKPSQQQLPQQGVVISEVPSSSSHHHSRTMSGGSRGSNDSADNASIVSSGAGAGGSGSSIPTSADSVISPRNKSTSAIIARSHTELDSKPSRKSVGAALSPPELSFSAAILHTSPSPSNSASSTSVSTNATHSGVTGGNTTATNTTATMSSSSSSSRVSPSRKNGSAAAAAATTVQFDPLASDSMQPPMSRAAKRKSASSAMAASIASLSATLNEDYLASPSPTSPKASKPRHASSTRSLGKPLNMEEVKSSSKKKVSVSGDPTNPGGTIVSPRASRRTSTKSPDKTRLNAIDLSQVPASYERDSSITASSDSPNLPRAKIISSPRGSGSGATTPNIATPNTTTAPETMTTSSTLGGNTQSSSTALPPMSPTSLSKKEKRSSERRLAAESPSLVRKSVGRAPSEEPRRSSNDSSPASTTTTTSSSSSSASKKGSEAPTSSSTPTVMPPVRRAKSSILTPISASSSSEAPVSPPAKKDKKEKDKEKDKDKKDKKEKDKS